jgi:hypothetical protein
VMLDMKELLKVLAKKLKMKRKRKTVSRKINLQCVKHLDIILYLKVTEKSQEINVLVVLTLTHTFIPVQHLVEYSP